MPNQLCSAYATRKKKHQPVPMAIPRGSSKLPIKTTKEIERWQNIYTLRPILISFRLWVHDYLYGCSNFYCKDLVQKFLLGKEFYIKLSRKKQVMFFSHSRTPLHSEQESSCFQTLDCSSWCKLILDILLLLWPFLQGIIYFLDHHTLVRSHIYLTYSS